MKGQKPRATLTRQQSGKLTGEKPPDKMVAAMRELEASGKDGAIVHRLSPEAEWQN